MAKDMSGFMKSFAGNLGKQLGGLSGMNMIGGPMSGIGMMEQMMGGNDYDPTQEDNPGNKMFKGKGPNLGERFMGNLSDQLFQKAMMGFMGR